MVEKPKKDSVVDAEEKEVVDTEDQETDDQEDGQVKDEDFVPKVDAEGDGETSSDPEEDAISKKDDAEGEETGLVDEELSLDDFDDGEEESEKKTGFQKRIDRLMAEKTAAEAKQKVLEERLAKVEQSQNKSDKPVYTETQLRTAMAKAMEEGDANLMWEIMSYRVDQAKTDALSKYEKQQLTLTEAQKKHGREWMSVVEEYSYLSDKEEPELYKGSHNELNISKQDSLLYKLAVKLYTDPEKAERYGKDGGQRLAVSDAVRLILRKKNTKVSSKENEKLKRQLAKEKKKSSVSSGKAIKADTTKPASAKTSLEDYMAERQKQKAKVAGSGL